MSKKYKEADVRNAIKQGLKNYADLARVRVKSAWKNMSLQEQCAVARSLVFMEHVAKNPDAYFSRETTEESWRKRATEYMRTKRFFDFGLAYYMVADPTGVVMSNANAAFFDRNSREYERFCKAVQQWMYDGHSDTYSAIIMGMTKECEANLEYESANCLMRPFIEFKQSFQK